MLWLWLWIWVWLWIGLCPRLGRGLSLMLSMLSGHGPLPERAATLTKGVGSG